VVVRVGAQIVSDPVSFPLASDANLTITAYLATPGRRSTTGSGTGFDAVVDFDARGPGPAAPRQLNPAYDTGDHLHMNPGGIRRAGPGRTA
jgi:hypothetical protein